jgi:hypothetical protein
MNNFKTNDIIFLGFCDRAAYVPIANTNILKWNILGLRSIVLAYIFPFNISGLIIGFAFSFTVAKSRQRFSLTEEKGEEIGTIMIDFHDIRKGTPDASEMAMRQKGPWIVASEYGWMITFLPLKDVNIIITKPGTYYLNLITDEGPQIVGEILFAVINPPPLTPERIAAIKSDPNAAKQVRIEIGCKKCPSKLRAYASIERDTKMETSGWEWYETISNDFTCKCGSTTIDLDIIRKNLHGMLGHRMGYAGEIDFVPLYERSSIERIRKDFLHLLNSAPKEEILQQFLDANPIVLHQFPSEKIFSKPPILTFFAADFAIVTPQKELILIELEKTTTRLMKKKGGIAAPLSHAFDQVRGWLHVVDEHRLAVLDSLKIERELVSVVRGVVIAGRDIGYDAQHLRKLKGADWGRITFLTYDDLLFALDALIRKMTNL